MIFNDEKRKKGQEEGKKMFNDTLNPCEPSSRDGESNENV